MEKTFKCAFCKNEININENSIDMISFKNKKYHIECFKSMCNERVFKNDEHSLIYAKALKNIEQIKERTKKTSLNMMIQDSLNLYLLDEYNADAFSCYFWSMIKDLQKGVYKQRTCSKIDLEILTQMWKDSQNYLNKKYVWKKQHGINMTPEERVRYDLAILLSNYNKYIEKKERNKYNEITAEQQKKQMSKINYENIIKQNIDKKESSDIVDIMNDIF